MIRTTMDKTILDGPVYKDSIGSLGGNEFVRSSFLVEISIIEMVMFKIRFIATRIIKTKNINKFFFPMQLFTQ
jgi:hypothetical protein